MGKEVVLAMSGWRLWSETGSNNTVPSTVITTAVGDYRALGGAVGGQSQRTYSGFSGRYPLGRQSNVAFFLSLT